MEGQEKIGLDVWTSEVAQKMSALTEALKLWPFFPEEVQTYRISKDLRSCQGVLKRETPGCPGGVAVPSLQILPQGVWLTPPIMQTPLLMDISPLPKSRSVVAPHSKPLLGAEEGLWLKDYTGQAA